MITAPYMLDETQLYNIIEQFDDNEYDLIIPNVNEKLTEEDLMKLSIKNVEGVICGDDDFTKRVIDTLPNLKVIVKWGTGIDSINKEYAVSKGIKVMNTPGAFTIPVAETTIGLILSFIRTINESNFLMKKGKWVKPKGKTISELTIGIIGLGEIGNKVAETLQHFGNPKIIYYDIVKKHTNLAEYRDLDTLLEESDVITLHCDLNPTSRHILDEDSFNLMKYPYIINTARGGLIDQMDLIDALDIGKIAGAGLDVYENEPIIDPYLSKMKNVIMLSHNANSSQKYWNKVHKNSIKMLKENL